jgi:hypothetical protein
MSFIAALSSLNWASIFGLNSSNNLRMFSLLSLTAALAFSVCSSVKPYLSCMSIAILPGGGMGPGTIFSLKRSNAAPEPMMMPQIRITVAATVWM